MSRVLDILETVEIFLYRRAAMVICVTNSFPKNLAARGVDPGKLRVVTNGADMTHFQPRPKDAKLIESLGLERKFITGYIGTLGMAHGLNTLLDAAKLLAVRRETADVRLVFVGDGAERAALESRIRNEVIGNVLMLGSVPREEVARYWSILDLAIIHLRRSELFKTVIPSKLFECMAMGVPVLHAVEGESAEIVTSTGMGVVVIPESPEQIVEEVEALMAAPDRIEAMANAGVNAAKEYDRAILAQHMVELLREVSYKN